jgi:hypothetical protein
MYKFAVNKAVEVATLNQLAFAPTASTALIIDTPRRLRAVTAIVLPTTRKFPADCAGGPAKKPTDALLTVATLMLGENHATFLAVEVLTFSVHRNILCPAGFRCCT